MKKKTDIAMILLPLLLIVFLLFVYSPVSVYLGNQTEYDFSLIDFLPHSLLFALCGAVVITGLWLLLPKKGRDVLAAVLFAIGVGLFLQGNFLNPDYGVLDGRGVHWAEYTRYAVVNTSIWGVLLITAVVLILIKRDIMASVIRYASVAVTVYQALMLVILFISTPILPMENEFVVGAKGKNTLSSQQNTVIFLVDACDTTYFQRILDEEPQVLEDWDGFTYYPDFVGSFSKTRMSVPYMLTGKWYENKQTMKDFIDQSFDDVYLWDALEEANYDIGVYTHREFLNTDLIGKFDNLIATRLVVADHFGLARQWLKLACFVYMPHILKAPFEFYSGDFNRYHGAENGEEIYISLNEDFIELAQGDFELTDQNTFRFYHIRGSHLPCNIDAEGNYVGDWKSTAYDQTKGMFKYITLFMNKMKGMGIYDGATIIITADHGRFDEGIAFPVFVIKRPGASGQLTVCNTPASQTELHATILQCAGLSVPEGTTSIFDLDPDSDYQRRFMYYPTSYYNDGYLPDLEEHTISRGLEISATGRWFTRQGITEKPAS